MRFSFDIDYLDRYLVFFVSQSFTTTMRRRSEDLFANKKIIFCIKMCSRKCMDTSPRDSLMHTAGAGEGGRPRCGDATTNTYDKQNTMKFI